MTVIWAMNDLGIHLTFSRFFFCWNNQIVLISFGLELIAIIFQHGWKIGGWCQTKTTYHIQSECTHLLLELVLVKVKHSAKIGFSQLQLKFQMHNFHSRKSLVSTNKQYKKKLFLLVFFRFFFLFAFMLVTRFNFYLSPSLERERYYGGKKVALIKYSFDLIYGHLTQKQDYNFCVSLLLIFIYV